MWSTYYSVTSLAEALSLLAEHGHAARIIAGGTDMLIELEQGKRPGVTALIDLSRVPSQDAITKQDGLITLGPLVNHNHVVASAMLRQYALPLVQASWEVGAPQIRNRATVAGNLITASPANDTITPLLALDARVSLASAERGTRTVQLAEFYTGLRQTVMQPDELLTAIQFAPLAANQRGVFIKLGLRRAQAISVVNCAVVLSLDAQKQITQAAITLGSVAPTVMRVPEAEALLIGQALTPEVIAKTARAAAAVPKPIDDVRSSAAYRTEMVKVLVARALRTLAQDETANSVPENPAMLWGATQARIHTDMLPTQITHTPATPIETTINGKRLSISSGQGKTLLHWLREDANLTGTKEGCSEGECGACTVLLDGVSVMACMVAAPRAHGATLITIEGLQGDSALHPLQQAFIEQGAVQCGYCTPGFVMAGAALLQETPQPTQEQIQQSISGNLCRCTGYYKIVEAFKQASAQATTTSTIHSQPLSEE